MTRGNAMRDNGYRLIGNIDGTEVGVRLTAAGQEILVQQSGIGDVLAQLLNAANPTPGQIQTLQVDDLSYWLIPHTDPVDELLKLAADLFIAIRYLHPAFVQLQLQLPETSQ